MVGDKVYVGTSDGHFLRAVDLATGAEAWTRATDYNVFASAAVIGDRLYAGSLGGTLQKMDLADGKGGGLILQERIYASPWIEDGVLYFATADGIVYAQTNSVFPPPK